MTYPALVLAAMLVAGSAGAFAIRTRQYALAGIAGAGLVFWMHSLRYMRYTSDDSYISYRYARNFADGIGLVWNRGESVEGYTNFLWVVMLAATHKLGADLVFTGRWLGFALGLAAIAATYVLARTLAGGEAGRIAGFAAVFLLAVSGPFAVWASAGLETSLFALLLLAAVLAHIREQDGDAPPLSAPLWALLIMTHPAGAVPFAVSAAFKLGEAASRIRGESDRRAALRRHGVPVVIWLGAFAAVYLPYFAWRYATYGWLFPNTYYAKVGSGLHQYITGLRYLNVFSQEYAIWILLVVPLAISLGAIRRPPGLYVCALIAAMFAYVVYVGGDGLLRYRFFAPMLPLIYAASTAAVASLARSIDVRPDIPRWAGYAAPAAAFGALLLFTLHASSFEVNVRLERVTVEERVAMGRWLHANLPGDTLVAVVPAGSIPYESQLPSIDMLGLNDEHIAHRDLDLRGVIVGHEKYDSEYVLDRAPDIIIINDHLTNRPWRLEDYEVLRAQVILAIPDMLASPRLNQEYEPRNVEIDDGRWFNVFVRRGEESVLSRTQPAPP